MVGTLGKGSRLERSVNAALHVLGSTVAAATVGLVLAGIGGLVTPAVGVALAVVICLAYGMMELGLITLPLPETGRQVPAGWRYRFPSPITATLYGALLGPGLGTRVAASSYMALLAVTTFASVPLVGALLLGVFGLTRAAAAAIAAQPARRDPARAMSWGYETAARGRLVGIVLTYMIIGALAARAVTHYLGA